MNIGKKVDDGWKRDEMRWKYNQRCELMKWFGGEMNECMIRSRLQKEVESIYISTIEAHKKFNLRVKIYDKKWNHFPHT